MHVASFRLLFMIVRDDPPQARPASLAPLGTPALACACPGLPALAQRASLRLHLFDLALGGLLLVRRPASTAAHAAPGLALPHANFPARLSTLPQLEGGQWSTDFKDFVWQCLRKVGAAALLF